MYSISSRKAAFAPQITIGFAGISGTYALAGVVAYPARSSYLLNLTNAVLTLTNDVTQDQITLPASMTTPMTVDFTTNKTTDNGLFLPVNTAWYVKGTGASSGALYIMSMYGKD